MQKMTERCIDAAVQTLQENPHFNADDVEFNTFTEEFQTTYDITTFMDGVKEPFKAMAEIHDRAIELIIENDLDAYQSTLDEFNLVWCDVGRSVCENEWSTIVEKVERDKFATILIDLLRKKPKTSILKEFFEYKKINPTMKHAEFVRMWRESN